CNLGQPDDGLDRFHLAEERPHGAEAVVAPMLEKPRRLGGYTPLALGQAAPRVYRAADLIDDRRELVLLLLGRKALAFVEAQLRLRSSACPLFRLRDRRDERNLAALLDDPLGRLTVLVELPVAARVLVWRIQDGLVEERVGHDAG